jgi:3-phosphoshikimate 1-carboxyvinyltransferase
MAKAIKFTKKIQSFNKKISIKEASDKSLSIRWAIISSLASGNSKAYNLLKSEDVINTLNCLKTLGVKIKLTKNFCKIKGVGLNGFNYKDNLVLNAGNSGTAARLIAAILINSPKIIKITGDNSLKKRDMTRIIEPLKKFGATFKKNNGKLPISIKGTSLVKPINYQELRGSAQCKTAVMLAALSATGTTNIKCLPSRDHTELLFRYLNIPIKIKKTKKIQYIEIKGKKIFGPLNYNIPTDISSASFFIVLTLISKNAKLLIKNVSINPSRAGIITILNKMGASIKFQNIKDYRGEKIANILIKSSKNLKAIKLPKNFNNSSAIDEFILIFICAAFAKGTSEFYNLGELNKKESRRLDWSFKILKMIGIKTKKIKNNGIKIIGNPNLQLNKRYIIKKYLKDHRIAMSCIVLALAKGGLWSIHNPESIKTSFPTFLKVIKNLSKR